VKILALDTATASCSAALVLDGRIIARERLLEHGHAGHILPMIDEVLAEAGIGLGALSAIAFGRGPGAFTGVRLAAAVTQGLAFGAGVPVVPVSDLQALAQRLLAADSSIARVVACTDARMREVYWGCFVRRHGLAAPVGDEQLSAPGALRLPGDWVRKAHAQAATAAATRSRASAAVGCAPEGAWGVGPGFAAYPELRAALHTRLDGVRDDLLPRAAEVATLALPEVEGGRVFLPEQALPVYLRDEVVRGCPPQSLK
jgi:tRNA threonylcarbamoyladenosine biosynthesis protein TsaB